MRGCSQGVSCFVGCSLECCACVRVFCDDVRFCVRGHAGRSSQRGYRSCGWLNPCTTGLEHYRIQVWLRAAVENPQQLESGAARPFAKSRGCCYAEADLVLTKL